MYNPSEQLNWPITNHLFQEAPFRSALEMFIKSRAKLSSDFRKGKAADYFQEEYSEIMDCYFRMIIQESRTGQSLFKKRIPFSLIAVGGYGRIELSLHSDIDILILFDKNIPSEAKILAEELFYPLWDTGMDLGYGIRTIKDCLSLSRNDFEVLTSVIDMRFICGSSELYLNLKQKLQKKAIKIGSSSFFRWLQGLNEIRIKRFGDASHLLEPDLKEGIGGLRDYHQILWMAKGFLNAREPKDLEHFSKFSSREYNDLQDCVKFIHLVRNHLHQLSGRKNDRLNFEYQEKIAKRLRYKNLQKYSAVEQFLSRLHSCMESIKILHRSFMATHSPQRSPGINVTPRDLSRGIIESSNEINFKSNAAIFDDPSVLMDIFEQSCRSGLPLSLEARRNVKESIVLIDDTFRRSNRVIKSFLNIINGKNCIETLDQMFETGFLDAFIPEFGMIKNRVQFDEYHTFPVGRHVLETVSNLKNISRQKDLLLFDIFIDIKNHEHLFLAALFHDIGKTGKGHARRGSQICRIIMERMGYPEKWTGEISFLINHHLLLAETATRRDLNDEKVIIDTARLIGDIERLKALYLLTWADSNATGSHVWTAWTENLVQELFFKAMHILEGGELATPDLSQKVMNLKTRLRRKTAEKINKTDFEKLFDAMSPRYKINTPPTDIVRHMEMALKLESDRTARNSKAFITDFTENKSTGIWKVSFIGKDRPGLFSDIAGAMALNNINILSANIYTWRDGTAVDIFSVTRPLDLIHPEETWERVTTDLNNVFNGKLSLSYRLGRKASPSILSVKGKPGRPPRVVIDNKTSDFFTLVETFADDRIGLLYLITRTLFELQLDIKIAKIGTKGDQIADVFYVRDLDGQKIDDENHVNEIRYALFYQLSGKL